MSFSHTTMLRSALAELVAAIDAYSGAVWNSDMQQPTDRYKAALRRAREALSDEQVSENTGKQA